MKKILFFILLGTAAWQGYTRWHEQAPPAGADFVQAPPTNETLSHDTLPSTNITFTCDGRQHCSQMGSFEEAEYFLKHCPNVKMDGDGDGIPCEKQFGYSY